MLNFRSASIYMIILAVVALLLMTVNIQYWWLLPVLAIIYLYLLVMGSVKICSGFYTDTFCRGGSADNKLTLTFDDGPDPEHTAQILEILEKHAVPATFFIIGNKAENQEDLLRQIISKGHIIGNHSFSHAFFYDLYRRKKMERDLMKTEELILKVTGKKPFLFRPPYGVTNPVVAKVAKKLGYKVIGWSVRSLDTVLKDADKITERVVERLHPGAVILMHDNRDVTPKALEMIITRAKEEGYRFVGLDELIGFKVNEN